VSSASKYKVYSIGYSGTAFDDLIRFVRARNLLLVDVRLKPVSRFQPHWNKGSLAYALGDNYHWLPELGNLNYKGGPVALKNEQVGMDILRNLLGVRNVAVLCACADYTRCHRTTVTEALAGEGYPIEQVSLSTGIPVTTCEDAIS
jgi:uncharacterized protein (DUF488 family)